MNAQALEGIRILDLTRIMAGPTCTQLLGDLGADVIKVERPGSGDDTRSWGPPFVRDADGNPTSQSAYYLSANRNKRSLAINIANPADVEKLYALLASTDVLIENFKLGGLAKYGLDYQTLAKKFPKLVYCSITGFGQTGPNAHKAGYDLMIQGFGGIMSLTGEPEGEPMKVGVAIADVTTGLYASTAILAALRHVDRTGQGQHIDIALADVQTSWLINQGTNYLCSGQTPQRHGNAHPNIVPYQVFEANDGHVIIAVGNDRQFAAFSDAVGHSEWATDTRFATNTMRLQHREALCAAIADVLIDMPKGQIVTALEDKNVPCGLINTVPELFQSDQVNARDMVVEMDYAPSGDGKVRLIGNPIKMSQTPVTYRQAPPLCGEHNVEILDEIQQVKPTKR